MNSTLEKYCTNNGISLEFTIPHMPEQNSVAKRTNWRILDKGRVIMKEANALDFLWADAFVTIIYAMNHTVSTRAGDKTPFEAFFERKPGVSHMRVWLSDVFIHHPKDL